MQEHNANLGNESAEGTSALGIDFTTSGRRLVYLAAERTLMAWTRTALATMAFGFVVDRFDVFLRRSGILPLPESSIATFGHLGTPIVLVGALMAAVGAARYLAFARRYRKMGDAETDNGLFVGSLFAILIAILGGALVFFLATVAG